MPFWKEQLSEEEKQQRIFAYARAVSANAVNEMNIVKTGATRVQYPNYPEKKCPICTHMANNIEEKQYAAYCGRLAPTRNETTTEDQKSVTKMLDKLLKAHIEKAMKDKTCPICSIKLVEVDEQDYKEQRRMELERREVPWRGEVGKYIAWLVPYPGS
ncbi:hypothetical protein P154DRAFT_533945 [Amniculicola lignicola CBS 123094]|uniref:Uncharacterized protein n=1 Tax=Amniculicola lignicola CBS 123094 TaxID=1392246 RepID=A0A6A5WQQ4_9PLEO|nr:hypothetical protein P154DRAFT_533945 [Amniculicola lignicola CBS 123094]